MDSYVRALLDRPILGRAEEHALAVRAVAGDRTAREELIAGSLRFVAARAVMLGFADNDLADAVQAGTLGLIRAVDTFDPDRGVLLRTWAWWPIGRAMRAALPPAREQPMGSSSDLPQPC